MSTITIFTMKRKSTPRKKAAGLQFPGISRKLFSSGKKRLRPNKSEVKPAKDIKDELRMNQPAKFDIKKGPISEHNGLTRQKAKSYAPRRRYTVSTRDLSNIFCPVYKFRYDGYGFNTALTQMSGADNTTVSYNSANAVTTYGNNALGDPAGTWRSCEWAAGNQYWFESIALPFYKKIPNGTTKSIVELIQKYPDIVKHNALNTDVSMDAFFRAVDTYVNEGETVTKNKLIDSVNICYHGGKQTHTFINFGLGECELELWELHPRVPLSGYVKIGTTAGGNNIYRYDWVWSDLIRDLVDGTTFNNNLPTVDDYKAINEAHDIGVRIDGDCRTIHYKYKVGKPIRTRIAPGGQFTYEMNLPAFKVTGGEFLEYLVRSKDFGNDTSAAANALREELRPSFIPRFTRILCGRIIGQKSYRAGTDTLKADGNTADTSYIKALGYGPGKIGHMMSEYHEMNAMPSFKESCYQRMSYLDTDTGMTRIIDGGDDDQVDQDAETGNDMQFDSSALTVNTSK